jgi:pyruvate dehydrogenase E2 component (dihydrolipoamide acetyltransferase)
MSEDLFIPKLGQTVEEVVLINWLVEDGARVDFGDPVLEVETDKAVFSVEANAKGFIHFGPYSMGETLPVLTVVATVGKPDEGFSPSASVVGVQETADLKPEEPETDVEKTVQEDASQPKTQRKVFASPRARKLAQAEGVDLSLLKPTGGGGRRVVEQDVKDVLLAEPAATPIALQLARNVGLSLNDVSGTGPKGRITRADVETEIRRRLEAFAKIKGPVQPTSPSAEVQVEESRPLQGVRRLIFDRMSESVQKTARVTLVMEADATDLVKLRERLKAEKSADWGFSPGYNDLIGLVVARVLKAFPYMNARLNAENQTIEILQPVNLGVAVDTERGLVVPVIKGVDQMGLESFGRQFRTLVERAVAGRPRPDDLEGGTFTITNLGSYNVDAFTPVINLPEAAILGLGQIHDAVVPIEGEIQIRKVLTLSLVFDHRLVDGAPAARFLQQVKQEIETAASADWQTG